MKRLLALVLTLVLLTGCTGQNPPDGTTEGLPEQHFGELTYFCVEAVEEMEATQLLSTPEGLLVSGGGRLVLLSKEDLSVMAECTLEASELAYVQVLEDRISVADPGTGTITLLGNDLSVSETLPCEAGENTWLVRSDVGEIYTLASHGIDAWSLDGSGSRELLRCRFLSVLSVGAAELWLTSVGKDDIMNHWYRLDLADGTLEELEGTQLLALQEGLRPQPDGTYLRIRGNEVRWYDENGGFMSGFSLPGDSRSLGTDFAWVEGRGWFLLVYGEDGCQMMLWEPVHGDGEDIHLALEPVTEGAVLPRELYERAEALSERFDLDIRIADRAIRDYGSYDSGMLTDPELTTRALDVLEEALAVYPEGFFSQLKYGNRHSVRIELVDGLKGKAGHDVSSGTSAVTMRRDRYCMIVLNARRIRNSAIFHEFSHIMDDRMAFEARLRPDALYSEERWLALQPEGFRYADSYQDIPEEVKKFYDSGYFTGSYACVSATEDRAVTMEKAMMLETAVFEANPHLMPKLRYYCECIRDSFDTTNWPEVLPWERLLG